MGRRGDGRVPLRSGQRTRGADGGERRFWGSLPLAIQAAQLSVVLLSGARTGQAAAAGLPEGVRCRYMTAETRRLLHLRTWRELAGYLLEFLRPRSGYFIHDWRDPLPLWRDLRHSVLQRCARRYPAKGQVTYLPITFTGAEPPPLSLPAASSHFSTVTVDLPFS
jgi:hypothetical protein